MPIIQDKNLEFEQELLELLIKYDYIPEDKKTLVKKAELTVYGDKPMILDVHEHED